VRQSKRLYPYTIFKKVKASHLRHMLLKANMNSYLQRQPNTKQVNVPAQIAKHFRELHYGVNWTSVNFKTTLGWIPTI
jgi:hypothetical protein